ncbi:MAG: T9SS type A sorting domain-containing protein, partial [Cytophagales bacterium]|nr:T9SS type A sorting domain-containing protein [Cytophagales bacterium]
NSWQNTHLFGTAVLKEMELTTVSNAVAEISKPQVSISFTPPVPGLTKDDMTLLNPSGLKLSLKSVETSDNGATYQIQPNIGFVESLTYKFIASSFGFEFDTLAVVLPVATVTATEAGLSSTVKIHPNPAHGTLYVQAAGVVSAQIRSLTGHTVASGGNTLDIAHLLPGTYVVFVHFNGRIQHHKLIVQ